MAIGLDSRTRNCARAQN